jgi:hypothetical protein
MDSLGNVKDTRTYLKIKINKVRMNNVPLSRWVRGGVRAES